MPLRPVSGKECGAVPRLGNEREWIVKRRRTVGFWILQGPGWLLLLYLIYAQGVSAISYDLGVSMGTQEPAERITEVGAAFWFGFAFGDLIFYIPLLLMGLIGHLRGTHRGAIALAAALGMTVYWPIVSLAALVDARDAPGWEIASEAPYWFVCLLISAWGAFALWLLAKNPPATHTTDRPVTSSRRQT